MNGIWQTITPLVGAGSGGLSYLHWLAQAAQPTEPAPPTTGQFPGVGANLGPEMLIPLLTAIAILVIGWLVAVLIAAAVKNLLRRTDWDQRVAGWVMGDQERAQRMPVERWAAGIVFWVIMIFVLIAFLQSLGLAAVTQPLDVFLTRIFEFLPRIGAALILLLIAWLLATVVRLLVIRTSQAFGLDEWLSQQTTEAPPPEEPGTSPEAISEAQMRESTETGGPPFLLSETLGNILYWFIFLIFLPPILATLELEGALRPAENLLNQILAVLPRIFAAIIIAIAGWFVARIIRGIVTNLLAAAGTDRLGVRMGLNPRENPRAQSLSWLLGTLVYILVLIPVAIAALQALAIEAISAPAIAMLQQVLLFIPPLFVAIIVLIVAYYIGRFVGDLVTRILSGVGFDNVFSWMGLQAGQRRTRDRLRTEEVATYRDPMPGVEETYGEPIRESRPSDSEPRSNTESSLETPTRTPSEIVGIIVLVGIVLLAVLIATDILGLVALTALVAGLLTIFGQVLVGIIIFGIGLYLANLAHNLISSSGSRQSNILGQTARIAIIALTAAMALQQMGIATSIINLAFGLLVGAIAVATALAFGLGGREIAAEQLREWSSDLKRRS